MLGGALLALVGVVVLLGWEPSIYTSLHLPRNPLGMRSDSALGFFLLGVSVLALESNAGRFVWLAIVPAAIGLITLFQSTSGRNLHLLDFLAPLQAATALSAPSRMPGLSALGLLTGGVSLLLFKCPRQNRWCRLGIVLGASLTISIGLAPLLGRILGLSEGSALHPVLRPSPLEAFSCVLLGALLLNCLWHRDPERRIALPAWLPVPVAAVGATLTILFAAALRDREASFVNSTTQLAINNVATVLSFELQDEAEALQRMAAQWAKTRPVTDEMRNEDVAAYRENFPALNSVTWISQSGRILGVYPRDSNEYLLDFDHRSDPLQWKLIQQVQETGRPAFSDLMQLPLTGLGFFSCAPLPGGDQSGRQVLLGKYSYAAVIEALQSRLHLPALYSIVIDVDGRRVFERYPPEPTADSLREESNFNLFNQQIRISLSPAESTLKQGRRYFPQLFAALGFGLSLLLGAVAHLARTSALRRRAAEQATAQLVGEVEERARAEQALGISQAATRKLSLVASSTDNLVAIIDTEGRLEWVNQSVMRLFDLRLDELVGSNIATLFAGPDAEPSAAALLNHALHRATSFNADLSCQTKDGRVCHLHLDLQPVRNQAGTVENFIAMMFDITTRVETEQHLRRAKEEADAASRAKSEFLAAMSHEIRTPMNGVIGMTSLLLETTLTVEQRECVNTIRTSGDSLLAIINDILDFSKIESGRLDIELHPFELAACIEEALDLFAVQAGAKCIDLAYDIAPEVPSWIFSDATRLRQILVNLVNNAIKFTPRGNVSVEVSRTSAPEAPMPKAQAPVLGSRAPLPKGEPLWLAIAVRDSGIGIPAEKHHRLFQPFSQVDSSTTRKYGGTGLGLAISRRGHGSVFTILLPTYRSTAPAAQTHEDAPPCMQGRVAWVVDGHDVNRRFLASTLSGAGLSCTAIESAQTAQARAASSEPPALLVISQVLADGEGRHLAQQLRAAWQQPQLPLILLLPGGEPMPRAWAQELAPVAHLVKPLKAAALLLSVRSLFAPPAARSNASPSAKQLLSDEISLKILLVEDNPVNRNVALSLLSRLGYKADSVVNGIEAIKAFNEKTYDLVLMDLQMPVMDGLEATRELRRRLPPERQPRIVAVTANALVGDREACLAAGMDDYVTKPLKLDGLASAIRRNCAKSAAG
jgi:PAS domain S-box-containing protein